MLMKHLGWRRERSGEEGNGDWSQEAKAMNLILGNLNLSPKLLFHKVSVDHLHVNQMGVFFLKAYSWVQIYQISISGYKAQSWSFNSQLGLGDSFMYESLHAIGI